MFLLFCTIATNSIFFYINSGGARNLSEGGNGKCPNMCFFCTQKPAIHCPSIRLGPIMFQWCDQCPGEDEHVQNEVHALLICQDHRVCELRKHFSFLFSPFFEDLSAAQPFLLQQVNNQLVHDFLSQQDNRLFLFLSELMDLFVAGRDQSAAGQPILLEDVPHPVGGWAAACHWADARVRWTWTREKYPQFSFHIAHLLLFWNF